MLQNALKANQKKGFQCFLRFVAQRKELIRIATSQASSRLLVKESLCLQSFNKAILPLSKKMQDTSFCEEMCS